MSDTTIYHDNTYKSIDVIVKKVRYIRKELVIFFKRHVFVCVLLLFCIFIIARHSSLPVVSFCPSLIKRILLQPEKETNAFFLSEILNNFALAFIAALIFYIVVNYVNERKLARKALVLLNHEISSVYMEMGSIIGHFLFYLDIDKTIQELSIDDLSDMDEKAYENKGNRIKIISYKNGKEVGTGYCSDNIVTGSKNGAAYLKKNLEIIVNSPSVHFLDSDLISVLVSIQNCGFITFVGMMDKFQNNNPSYGKYKVFAKSFIQFVELYKDLNKYDFDKVITKYHHINKEETIEDINNQKNLEATEKGKDSDVSANEATSTTKDNTSRASLSEDTKKKPPEL